MNMRDAKERLKRAFPIFSRLFRTGRPPLVTVGVITGGAAGSHTLAAIRPKDEIISVINLNDAVDLTSEFSITGSGTIDNTGGTATTGDQLMIHYFTWDLQR